MSVESDEAFHPTLVFARARRFWLPLGLVLVLGLTTIWLGRQQAPIPSATVQAGSTLPMWRLLAMAAGILPALGMHSGLSSVEEIGTDLYRAMERRYLLVLTVVVWCLYLLVIAASLPGGVLLVIARSLLGWTGLAILSGRIFGWRLSWVIPVGASFALIYWGGSFDGTRDYRWWEFSAAAYPSVSTLGLSMTLLLIGGVAFAVTPWRLRKGCGVKGGRTERMSK